MDFGSICLPASTFRHSTSRILSTRCSHVLIFQHSLHNNQVCCNCPCLRASTAARLHNHAPRSHHSLATPGAACPARAAALLGSVPIEGVFNFVRSLELDRHANCWHGLRPGPNLLSHRVTPGTNPSRNLPQNVGNQTLQNKTAAFFQMQNFASNAPCFCGLVGKPSSR